MLSLHPLGDGAADPALATAARDAMLCSLFCTSCADACSAEAGDMRACIRRCLDCAEVCAATARLAVRRTGGGVQMLRAMLETCIRACELCAEECRRHDHEHCTLCAQMCSECAGDCRAALASA